MGMMINRRRACSGKKSLLPSGYKQLEYIKNISKAYIDTKKILNQNTTIICTFKYNILDENWPAVFGSKKGSDNRIGFFIERQTYWACRWNSNGANVGNCDTQKHTIVVSKGKFTLDGETIYTFSQGLFSIAFPLFIFVEQDSGRPANFPGHINLYRFEIYNNDIKLMDLIPCINLNNVVGMYDTIEGKFYSSPNGTAFVAGPEV